ncbi:MAG: hypothetical protein HQL63_10625 [Magnetococcales bacterium]|nr:hypothetical protein [Magnetococcales bacterium]MBF0322300.1 hypothetical protein [Magnetococcales bacterium]
MKPHRVHMAALLALALGGAGLAQADDIPWDRKPDESKFEWAAPHPTQVLKMIEALVSYLGIVVSPHGKIEGEIPATEFKNEPRAKVLARLCEQFDLDYQFNAETKVLTLYRKGQPPAVKEIFYATKSKDDDVFATLRRLEDDQNLSPPPEKNGTRKARQNVVPGAILVRGVRATLHGNGIVLKGDLVKVKEVVGLLKAIDEGYAAVETRQRTAEELQKRENADRERRANISVETIPLRHVTVGPSEMTFQGRTITVPGIIDTLKALFSKEEFHIITREEEKEREKKALKDAKELAEGKIPAPDPTRDQGATAMVMADQRNNQIIVRGTPKQIKDVADAVRALDQPPDLVEIEVIIVQGEDQISKELGVRWGAAGNMGGKAQDLQSGTTTGTGSISTTGQVTNLAASAPHSGAFNILATPFPGDVSSAGFIYQGSRGLLDATLRTMESANQLETIASPRVVTLNNTPARITNANNFYFVVSTTERINSDLHTVNTGVQLLITPSVVRAEGDAGDPLRKGKVELVRLQLNARNSIPTAQTAQGVNTNEQEIQTNVLVPEQSTFVLGGLFNNRREEMTEKVPLLGDVPLLGNLFKYQKSDDRKIETVFLITPRVISPNQLLAKSHQETREYVESRTGELGRERGKIRHESQLLPDRSEVSREEE